MVFVFWFLIRVLSLQILFCQILFCQGVFSPGLAWSFSGQSRPKQGPKLSKRNGHWLLINGAPVTSCLSSSQRPLIQTGWEPPHSPAAFHLCITCWPQSAPSSPTQVCPSSPLPSLLMLGLPFPGLWHASLATHLLLQVGQGWLG